MNCISGWLRHAAPLGALALFAFGALLPRHSVASDDVASIGQLEEIYVLRSIREPHDRTVDWCSKSKTGFEPFPNDGERVFSFWSIETQPDGKISSARNARVGDLHACFGATGDPARQRFYAEIKMNSISFRGRGECLALQINFPEANLFPVRCHLLLSDLPATYVGGLLTTNTLTSKAAFGGRTDPEGYTQASIATIRLWKKR
jgi:hypothetical protein